MCHMFVGRLTDDPFNNGIFEARAPLLDINASTRMRKKQLPVVRVVALHMLEHDMTRRAG